MLCVECEEICGAEGWDVFEKPGADDILQSTSVFCRAERAETRKQEMSPQGGRNQ